MRFVAKVSWFVSRGISSVRGAPKLGSVIHRMEDTRARTVRKIPLRLGTSKREAHAGTVACDMNKNAELRFDCDISAIYCLVLLESNVYADSKVVFHVRTYRRN